MPPKAADVEVMLDRWRAKAGPDWRGIFRHRLDVHARAWAGRGDPLDAWAGLLLARALGEPPPPWILDYLAGCAAGIHDLTLESERGEAIKPAAVGRALGMVTGGRGTAFPGPDAWDWLVLAVQVRDWLGTFGKEYLAIEQVAKENGVPKSTVRAAFKRFQRACPELV